MPPENKIAELEKKIDTLQDQLSAFILSDRYLFQRNIQLLDGRNIQVAKSTGTKIGTETTQKLGFWGTTPAVQFNSTGENTGHNGLGGVAVTHTDNWYGGATFSAGNRYTINDIVKALKTIGILAP